MWKPSAKDFAALERESFWTAHQPFLESAGYQLRPKYKPGWKPTWKSQKEMEKSPDRRTRKRSWLMDATRVLDAKPVMLKKVSSKTYPHEVQIGQYLTSGDMGNDKRNHCVPIYEVLHSPLEPDIQIVVMPRLRAFYDPPFETVGEFIDCLRQVFEGIQFMHENFVAHRDCTVDNIMLDPTNLYPKGFHPIDPSKDKTFTHAAKHITRTDCWPRYYLIDFGLSRKYDPSHGPPLELPIRGGDKSVPEHHIKPGSSEPQECNPFPTDIYYLGNMIKESLLHYPKTNFRPLSFLIPLCLSMTQEDPLERPTIFEVVERFDALCRGLTLKQLREYPATTWYWSPIQSYRHIQLAFKGVPPVPPLPDVDADLLSKHDKVFYTQSGRDDEGRGSKKRVSMVKEIGL